MAMDILEALREKGVEVRENLAGQGEYKICCPFCVEMGSSPDYRFRFGFNIESGLGHCYNCNYSTRKALLVLFRKLELGEIDMSLSRPGETRERPKNLQLPEGFTELARVSKYDDVYGEAVRYLEDRGITRQQMQKKRIGSTAFGLWRDRVIFPMYWRGKLKGWQGRAWDKETEPRYRTSDGSKWLYNLPDGAKGKWIVISEGVFKALAIEQATWGKLASVAPLGSTLTLAHTTKLAGYENAIVFLDPDKAGRDGGVKTAQALETLMEVYVTWPQPQSDADELSASQIRAILRKIQPWSKRLEYEIKPERWLGEDS